MSPFIALSQVTDVNVRQEKRVLGGLFGKFGGGGKMQEQQQQQAYYQQKPPKKSGGGMGGMGMLAAGLY